MKKADNYLLLSAVSFLVSLYFTFNQTLFQLFLLIGGFSLLLFIQERNRMKVMEKEKGIKDISKYIDQQNIQKDHMFICSSGKQALVVDESKELLYIVKTEENDYQLIMYKFDDILESEIKEDEITVSKTSRRSQVGGALVGGVLGGGIGAVIGGLSGERNDSDFSKSINLLITVNNLKCPVLIINFSKTENPMNKEDEIYQSRFSEAYKWHKLLTIIIHRGQIKESALEDI